MVPNPESVVLDLVCSLLAVNLWSVEKILDIKPALERESLLDMDAVARMSYKEVYDRLTRAGYSRGDYVTGLLSDRLLCAANELSGQGLARLCSLLAQDNIGEIDTLLLSIRGVGPHVLKNFKKLQGLD